MLPTKTSDVPTVHLTQPTKRKRTLVKKSPEMRILEAKLDVKLAKVLSLKTALLREQHAVNKIKWEIKTLKSKEAAKRKLDKQALADEKRADKAEAKRRRQDKHLLASTDINLALATNWSNFY